MKTHKIGVVVSMFFGIMAVIWELSILLGVAQNISDFKLGLLSLNDPFKVMPFDLSTAVMCIVFFIIGGYIFGWIFAAVYNKFHK